VKPRTLLILAIICGALAWLGLKEDGASRQVHGFKEATPFKNLDLNAVDDLLIVKGGDKLHLQRNDEGWKAVTDKLSFEAEFGQLKKLLLEVRDIEWLTQPARDDRHDAHFGLDENSQPGRLELKAKGETILALSLGKGRQSNKPSPFGGFQPEQGQHIRVDGTPGVFFAKERLGVSISPGDWINKVFAKADKDSISTIEINSLGRNLTFNKEVIESKDAGGNITKTEDLWKVEGDLPEKLRFLPTKASAWLDDLKEVQVQEPVATTLRKDFPSKAEHRITVKNGDEILYSLEAQNIDEEWYLWNQGDTSRLFKASKYVLENIFHSNEDLFDLKSQQPRISGNLHSVSWSNTLPKFSKKDSTWKVIGEGSQPEVEQAPLNNLSNTASRIETSDFFPKLERKSLNQLVIQTHLGELVLDDCGPSPFSNTHLVRHGGIIYTIPSASYDKLFPKANTLLKQEASFEGVADIKSISLPNFKLGKDDKGRWSIGSEKVRSASVSEWLNSFRLTLKSPYDPQGSSIKNPIAKINITTKDDESYSLQIGSTVKGKTPIKYSGFSGLFQANMDLVKSLNNGKGYFLEKKSEEKKEE